MLLPINAIFVPHHHLFNMTCLIPGCKSNYHSQADSYVPTFSFPIDVETRVKWIRAIPRQKRDYEKNKRILVSCYINLYRNIQYPDKSIQPPRKLPYK